MFNEQNLTSKPLLALMLLIGIVLGFVSSLMLGFIGTDNGSSIDRLDRVERLMVYDRFEFRGIVINRNTTLGELEKIYNVRHDYTRMFLGVGLGYVCDGDMDILFENMVMDDD